MSSRERSSEDAEQGALHQNPPRRPRTSGLTACVRDLGQEGLSLSYCFLICQGVEVRQPASGGEYYVG